jgi:hypothetical protein
MYRCPAQVTFTPVDAPNVPVWVLELELEGGWDQTWMAPVMAAVVFTALLLGVLLFWGLFSW